MMTVMTEAFGVHGENGDLVIAPKLVREQFDGTGAAAIDFSFAGKRFHTAIVNPTGRDFGEYCIGRACLSGLSPSAVRRIPVEDGRAALRRELIRALPEKGKTIMIELM